MIFTQTIRDLGYPAWKALGTAVIEIDPTDGQGYGIGYERTFDQAAIAFAQKYPGQYLVNTRIEVLSGDAHPSYRRIRMRLVGDLYSETD